MKAKPVILVVDDQPENIELLEAYLVPQGYEIVKAANGEDVLGKFSAHQIDLILMDVIMPGIDGFEVTRRVRQDTTHRLLPIILVTSLRDTEDRVKGIEAGCDDFVSKPVAKMELLATIKSLLRIKSLHDEVDAAREYAENIINTVREPLIALDQDLRVVSVSRSFYEVFKVNPKETVGQLIYDLGNKQWNIPKLRELLETILPQEATFDNYEVEHDFTTIGRRIMLLNARQIQRVLGKERIILLAIEDITERKRAKDALRMSEERFRSEFKGNPIPAYIWQKVGDDFVLGDFNTAAETTMHSNINRLRGVKASVFHSDRPDIIEELSRCCTEGCTIHREMLYTFPSTRGNKFLSVSYVFIPSDEIVVYAEDITERKLAEQQLKTSQDQLRALAVYLQNVREDERITIAREIHDELGQVLTALKMDLSLLEKTSAEQGAGSYQEEVSAEIKEMSSLVGSAIQTVRKLVKELRPEMLDILGLVPALRWQAEQFQQHTRIHCKLSLPTERVTLDPGRSIALFRILQESLTNVARHSKATTVLVKLVVEPEAVVLEIKDNGQGISETAMTNARSFGISGMQERAISFGGNVEVRGIPGKGTVVTARIQRG
ncbi:MAG: response regulator [Ignavibacteria bacterium]|nr:response regulator [Ignavibacteria bacterium]